MTSSPFSARHDVDASTLTVHGDIESQQLPQLEAFLALLGHGGTVDLSEATFLPSAALTILVAARRRAKGNGGRLRLVARPGTIASNILKVTGLGEGRPGP